MKCSICPREARSFGYDPILAKESGRSGRACSMKHLNILKELKGMVDPTTNEIEAALHGGDMGGEYLDWLGKTNLAALSAEEWQQFLLCVVGGYAEKIASNNTPEDNIPF